MFGETLLVSRFIAAGGLCLLAYLPFLSVPLISDDYIQLLLGRQYGPVSAWPALLDDVLYRCRSSSLLLTYALDSLFGPDATVHRLANLLFHCLNSGLVMLLGAWPRIGWRVSLPAGVFFAVHQGHQEAVVWSAALPELLVFLFAVGCLWLWLQGRRAMAFAVFLLALASKESAVAIVPVVAWFWWREDKLDRPGGIWLSAMAALSLFYAALIFTAGESHLHLNDAGTFSPAAPFLKTLLISWARLLWFWGLLAIAVLAWWRARLDLLVVTGGWMALMLLPYSFLTYMDRVPSRHTYLASAGLALLAGAAFAVLRERLAPRRQWAAAALAIAVIAHNTGYLWIKKLPQYYDRAAITERFLNEAARHKQSIALTCGAYPLDVYRAAVIVRLGDSATRVKAEPGVEESVAYCDPLHP